MQHFHYSYVINAAAALAHLRPSWATSDRVDWVNTLIRDVNDPNKVCIFPAVRYNLLFGASFLLLAQCAIIAAESLGGQSAGRRQQAIQQ